MTRSAEAVTLQGRFQLEDGMTRIELPHQDMPETKCYRLEGASVSRTRCFCVEGLALPITDGQAHKLRLMLKRRAVTLMACLGPDGRTAWLPRCPECDGRAELNCPDCDGQGAAPNPGGPERCRPCSGQGVFTCCTCGGKGVCDFATALQYLQYTC